MGSRATGGRKNHSLIAMITEAKIKIIGEELPMIVEMTSNEKSFQQKYG